MTAFDSCSNTTLIHKELINEGKVKVIKTQNSSNIKGIGGTAKGKVVTMDLTNRYGTRIRNNASVVDEIATIKKKDKARYELLTEESAEEVKRQEGYENITTDNFQLVPGGKIQLLIGLDVGNDFFPKEISTFRSGLKVSDEVIRSKTIPRFQWELPSTLHVHVFTEEPSKSITDARKPPTAARGGEVGFFT